MNISDTIRKRIKRAEDNLSKLRKNLTDTEVQEFSYLIGKCYRLAATCCVRINSIVDVDRHDIIVNCTHVQGGEYDKGNMEIHFDYEYYLNREDLVDNRFTEITNEKFESFINECADGALAKLHAI